MKIAWTDDHAPGAWPNGTRVCKINSEPGDSTPDGTQGTIVGSIDATPAKKAAKFGYFLHWDNRPPVPVFCVDTTTGGKPRLERVPQ